MIGFVIRDLPYLKLLCPIILEMKNRGIQYIIFHYDAPRGDKEYNRASLSNIKKSSLQVLDGAKKIKAFSSEGQLLKQISHDKITKLISVEIGLWAKSYLDQLSGIKLYSIQYLNDSIWQTTKKIITQMERVYYTTRFLMNIHHKFANINYNPIRDRYIGSPIFDCIKMGGQGDFILVLLPNLRAEHVKKAFGGKDKFLKIIEKISLNNQLLFKARKKQWVPNELNNMGQIIYDGDVMYPPTTSNLLYNAGGVVMFCSTGIYESVVSGNYVINVSIPTNRWAWDPKKISAYLSTEPGSLYNYQGVVETIDQSVILDDQFEFKMKDIAVRSRSGWIEKYVGCDLSGSAERIAIDIIGGR